jgi:hypothetical protein
LDHATPEGSDPATGGFGRVKLKVQNKTFKLDVNCNAIPDPNNPGKSRISTFKWSIVARWGQETDAVVVETKDISEPIYGFSVSHSEQYKYVQLSGCH